MIDLIDAERKKIRQYILETLPKNPNQKWLEEFLPGIDPAQSKQSTLPFHALFARGGKLIRPLLCSLAYQGLGGKEESTGFSIISEMIHLGTLMIDDLVDHSEMRRGKESIHLLFDKKTALVNGLLLCSLSQRYIEKSSLSTTQKAKLFSLYANQITLMSVGQLMDVSWSEKKDFSASGDECLQMYAYKSGSLFSMVFAMAGILANSSHEKELIRIGELLGVAFQLRDDILSLSSDAAIRKNFAEDLEESKMTYIVAHALKNTANPKALIESIKNNEIDCALQMIREAKSIDAALIKAQEIVESIKQLIDQVFVQSVQKEALKEIVEQMVKRNE